MKDPFDGDINIEQTDRKVICDEGKLIDSLYRQIRELLRENQKLSDNKHPFFKTVTWFILGLLTKLANFVTDYQGNQLVAERLWAEMVAAQRGDYFDFILQVADRTDSDAVMLERRKRFIGFGGKSSLEESRDKFGFAERIADRAMGKFAPIEKPVLFASVEPVILLVEQTQTTITTMLSSIDAEILVAEGEQARDLADGRETLERMQATANQAKTDLGGFKGNGE